MSKFLRVAANEYRRNVLKKSFIMVLLSLPLMIGFSLGLGLFLENLGGGPGTVGYVDQAGVFTGSGPGRLPGSDDMVEFRPFQSQDEANSAMEKDEIDAYYLVGADYRESRRIDLIYVEEPSGETKGQFFDFLQLNLLSGTPPDVAARIAFGTDVTVRTPDGKRTVPDGGPTFGIMMPLFINLAFLGLLLISSGYLMAAVAEEKENRTMEILVTSVSSLELIGGKIAGIVAIALTMLLTWSLIVVVAILIAANQGISWFQDLGMDWRIILATVIVAAPAYVLVAALMTAIGAMATTTQEGQSFSSIFIILHLIPLYVAAAFLNQPNSPIALTLSFLPFTSLMTIAMRNLFSPVPIWQAVVSSFIQILFALGALWIASRALRMGMLSYGQSLSWRRLFRALSRELAGRSVVGGSHE